MNIASYFMANEAQVYQPGWTKNISHLSKTLQDLDQMIKYFSNGSKVKLIGHCWGGLLVVGYLSRQPNMVSQAVLVEPTFLYPGAPVKEWVEKFKKEFLSFWRIARYLFAYPFVIKEDGHEGYDYIATKLANESRPGPPYNCKGQSSPPNMFKRLGYRAYQNIFQPIINDPKSFNYNFVNRIDKFQGDLILISTECSILGHEFQEKYNLPRFPKQTLHVKASNTGHNVLTMNPQWSVRTIRNFLSQENQVK